eukprot:7901649-Ditylum_brightwellii.AAC.2
MLSTEKKCQRANTEYAWLLKLVQAARTVCYWKIQLSMYRNNLPNTEYLYELENILNIQPQQSMPIKQLQSRLCNAQKALAKAQKNAEVLCDNFLEELVKQEKPNAKAITKGEVGGISSSLDGTEE